MKIKLTPETVKTINLLLSHAEDKYQNYLIRGVAEIHGITEADLKSQLK